MEDRRSRHKKASKRNFRKIKKEPIEEKEPEIENIVEEDDVEEQEREKERIEEQKAAFKKAMIETIAAQLTRTEEDVLEEYEKFYQRNPDGEIPKETFMEENKVR